MTKRLDQHLTDEGIFDSRARAKAAVMEGLVSVDGNRRVKPGHQLKGRETILVDEPGVRFVSRGGIKLDGALEDLELDVTGCSAIDVGASTGGFTDCLLRRGAERVIALDVGRGQLHWRLREDSRVEVIEGFNARALVPGDLPFEPDLAVVDVSFISLRKVIRPVLGVLTGPARIIALVKPQFEAGRGGAPRGVVRDEGVLLEVLRGIRDWLEETGLEMASVAPSRIRGPKGNAEFFVLIERTGTDGVCDEMLLDAIEGAPAR